MKRIIMLVLAMVIMVSGACLADVDLNGMNYDELIELQKDVAQAIWACDEWQEVTVPAGLYKVGEDIPAGKWVISTADPNAGWVWIYAGASLYENGGVNFSYAVVLQGAEYESTSPSPTQWVINLPDGYYITFNGDAMFKPYTELEFKFK